MVLIPVKTPLIVKKICPNYIWDIPTQEKTIYLTFDDGPTPYVTDWVLSTLRSYNAKATFFCIGKNVEANPNLFNLILKEGHTIGNHTQNHVKGWKSSTKNYIDNIKEAQNTFQNSVESNTYTLQNIFRPPYGKITRSQGKTLLKLGYKIIMWDVISFDWDKTLAKENCLKNVISKTKNGSIVVFHDSVKASKNMQYTLPKVLQHFIEKGYSFKALQF